MNWDIFIGRFHPLLVHLPIGIFILGYLFEVLLRFGFKKLIGSRKTIVLTYSLGFFFGLLAALTGWLLSFSNDYGLDSLSNHKNMGFVALVVMLLVIIYQIKGAKTNAKLKLSGSTLAIILISITGHLGGNLTHGDSYLTKYGPNFFKSNSNYLIGDFTDANTDSLYIYPSIIKPILLNKCFACHNSKDYQGGLNLDNFGNLFKEANHSTPIVAGDPDKSELLRRLSLPKDDEKFMPPREDGFNYTDIQVLRYWIENGADSLTKFNSETMSKELIALLNRDYGLDFRVKPYYEKVKSDSLDVDLFREVQNSKFRIGYLGENNYLLDVEFKGDSITKEQIRVLNKVSNQITFLKLSSSKLSTDLIKEMNEFPHLTRVDLSKNSLDSTTTTSFLLEHPHLESINLNNNDIDKAALEQILELDNLLRVYIWNTRITEEEKSSLSENYSNVDIISEFKFDKVTKAKSVFEQQNEE